MSNLENAPYYVGVHPLTNPFFHLTILLSVSQQPNEDKEVVFICLKTKPQDALLRGQ